MNKEARIKIRDEKALSIEVLRALKFFSGQLRKGWSIQEAMHQVESQYGERVYFYFLSAFKL